MFQFTDAVEIGKPRRTRDGYLVVDAKIARAGIQIYSGREMGKPQLDTVRVWRPEEEVFSDAAMASFTHRPVTDDHPSEMVSAANWKDHAIGMTGDSAIKDGKFVRVPFTLMDGLAIEKVEGGKVELSGGYVCQVDWSSGVTPEGETYDAVQRNIQGNHLAVVQRGRAGSECRIGDSWTSPSPQKDAPTMADTLRAVMVDGLTVHTTDQGAQAIEKLQRSLSDAASAVVMKDAEIVTIKADHSKALQAKDGVIDGMKSAHTTALSAKDGEIDALRAKMPDAAALDAMLVHRSTTIDAARRILGDGFDPKGKSDTDIRRAAVVKRMGDSAKDRDDSYVSAAFDALTLQPGSSSQSDPMRDAIRHAPIQIDVGDAESRAQAAQTKRLVSMRDAWKGEAA